MRILSELQPGYKLLTSYKTTQNGYEWFGKTPSHEALTSYGLMQFYEMSQVTNFVDSNMVQAAKSWLFSRKDGKGGFSLSS
jgi:alpha-2-macroglobulin-like protein